MFAHFVLGICVDGTFTFSQVLLEANILTCGGVSPANLLQVAFVVVWNLIVVLCNFIDVVGLRSL